MLSGKVIIINHGLEEKQGLIKIKKLYLKPICLKGWWKKEGEEGQESQNWQEWSIQVLGNQNWNWKRRIWQ